MNLDYIEVTKFLNKDSLSFDYLQKYATYPNATKYFFNGCNRIELWHNEALNQITLKGSIPYFLNGHNYFSTITEWKEGFDYINTCLKQNLYTGKVNCFEFGTIQEIPFSEDTFLKNHVKVKGMEARDFKKGNIYTGKYFEDTNQVIKLYDASRNIKTKLSQNIQEELYKHGWDKKKHFVKVENHYKKAENYFKRNIALFDVLSNEFQETLKTDLLENYNRIMKTGMAIIPKSKSDINAGTIPLMVLKELEGVLGFDTERIIKDKLKAIPEDVLNTNDRKARLRTIKENLKKISTSVKSEFDISELLEAKLNNH